MGTGELAANRSGSVSDSCGPYTATLTASGADKCFGRPVSQSLTRACPGANNPGLRVTTECPPNAVRAGETMTITGSVTNTGNVTLLDVTVTISVPALGREIQKLGPIQLLPGGRAVFSDSFVVGADCPGLAHQAVAIGRDKCVGAVVSDTTSKTCPVVGCETPGCCVIAAVSDPIYRTDDADLGRNQALWMRGISTNLVFIPHAGSFVENSPSASVAVECQPESFAFTSV